MKKQLDQELELSKSKKVFKVLFIIIFFILLVFLYSRFIGTKGLVVKEYKLINTSFVDNFYGLKIIHISDLHYGETTNETDLKQIIEKINTLKPDVVIFTGDLYSNGLEEDAKNELIANLKNITVSIKKYAIKGNHDDESWNEVMKESNFIDLNNNIDIIYNNNNSNILIAGVNTNDDINESIKKIDNLLKSDNNQETNSDVMSKFSYKILLLHEPDKILDFDYNNYDLILAGHSHNGQIRLPFIGALYTPDGSKKYYDEFYDLGNTKLYISSGIGTSKLKLRLFNRPSINLYRLTNK
ncbi:MAG: hypothetical protein HFI87_06575 [Bacilli bacterium]|nr:hypothetical protein [Bacilli bacterium]